jgi:exodeoxyribonuclease V alpha subunit
MLDVSTPPLVASLQPWIDSALLGPAEVHAAALVAEQLPERVADEVVLAFALALWAPQHGHSCVELDTIAADVATALAVAAADVDDAVVRPLPWPPPAAWSAVLARSAVVRVVDTVDVEPVLDERPLVLFGRRVYTQRQWVDECAVASAVRRRGQVTVVPTASSAVLDAVLPPLVAGVANLQHRAAVQATTRLFTVIAGGPGTGKTHTIGALLAAELAGAPDLRVALVAPTGKAASRLTEAVPATARAAGLEATTIHRLLRRLPENSTRFRHDERNPLELDLLVVDETSMLALPLAARLLAAVPDGCRVVFVGDPDQLNSIEVGAVLADLVAADRPGSATDGDVVRLVRQHRTGEDSPIGPLAAAIREGDADGAIDLLRDGSDERLRFVELADGETPDVAFDAVFAAVGPAYTAARAAALADDREGAFDAVNAARILCGHRRGPFGVSVWNDRVESRLTEAAESLAGRPLLATRNDPRTGLANGDPGVLVRAGTATRALFGRGDDLVTFDLAELDAVDTAYALTVHKSQGSQYATVAVVHPPAGSALVSRELLYTAVTRTSSHLLLVASLASIRRAVTTPTRRVTGLADALLSEVTVG